MQIFNEIDADGNGYITPDEVVVGYKKLGVELTLENAKAIVDEADTNKDGRISYDGECSTMIKYELRNCLIPRPHSVYTLQVTNVEVVYTTT